MCLHPETDCRYISPFNYEEADTRIIIHDSDAAEKGCKKLQVRTLNANVLVLAIAYVRRLDIQQLSVAFGTGKKFHYLAAHEISQALGSIKTRSLPMFHSFTGCDTVVVFAGKGKSMSFL